jgi:hypothetical protein
MPSGQPEGFLFFDRLLKDETLVPVVFVHREGRDPQRTIIDVDRLPGLARQLLDIYTDLKGLQRL